MGCSCSSETDLKSKKSQYRDADFIKEEKKEIKKKPSIAASQPQNENINNQIQIEEAKSSINGNIPFLQSRIDKEFNFPEIDGGKLN